MERDGIKLIYIRPLRDFNSHAHVERDQKIQSITTANINFNSHAHVERDVISLRRYNRLYNFNSHAHVERDRLIKVKTYDIDISTHTLTWSVTYAYGIDINAEKISTHTLTWSVTECSICRNSSIRFQLTRSRGA